MGNKYIYIAINIVIIIFLSVNIFNLTIHNGVAADSQVLKHLNQVGDTAKYDTKEDRLYIVVGRFIQTFLSFLGVIFILLTVYAGYLWMTARGKEEKVEEAQSILTNAVIGLVIIVAAYAITYFVLFYISKDYIKDSGF